MDSSTDDSDAYIPGLSKPGNMRHRVKGRRTPEVKANISVDRPAEDDLPPRKDVLVHDLSQSLDGHTQRRHSRKASFKDLRMEDKKRVANLIKELAKAGDEKERVVSQLHEERDQYEKQILELVAHQEEVLKEREDIQLKLFETQQMLTNYQEQMNKEDKEKKHKENAYKSPKEDVYSIDLKPLQTTHQKHSADDSVRFSPRVWKADVVDSENEEFFKLKPKPLPEQYDTTGYMQQQRPVPKFYNQAYSNSRGPATELYQPGSQRPYTNLIDMEIAQQRQVEFGLVSHRQHGPVYDRGGEYGPVSHGNNQELPHREYNPVPDRLIGNPGSNMHVMTNGVGHRGGKIKRTGKNLGPLREPIMSSTQKSSQIIEEMSFNSLPTIASENFQPLPVDASPRTTFGFSGQNGYHDNKRMSDDPIQNRNRVGFVERIEDLASARVHSPVLEGENEALGDRQFMEYYKKLTPAERKRELLRQRAALLEEQNRLKQILIEQETQLQEKQELLNQRHQQKLQECEDFQFKPVLDMDVNRVQFVQAGSGLDEQTHRHGEKLKSTFVVQEGRGMEDVAKRLDLSSLSLSRSNSDASSRRGRPRQLKSAGTSPIQLQTKTSVGTSPVRLNVSGRETSDIPDLVDAGTSVSYAHLTRSPQQSNLPLPVNRQRTSPSHKGAQSPGDKTLAILEIVNSLDRLSDSLNSSIHSQEEGIRHVSLSCQSRDHSLSGRVDQAEELEESRILEEVFFLK